jgi:hypothetical protein
MPEIVSNRKLVSTMLLTSRLARDVDVEEPEGVEATFSYSAAIESVQYKDQYTFAFGVLKVEKAIAGATLAYIHATYLFGFYGDRPTSSEAEFATLENLLEVTVWPRFRDLCEIITAQAEIDLPRLPLRPDSITPPRPMAEQPTPP